MNLWLFVYLVILYVSVGHTFLNHFKRYIAGVNCIDSYKLLLPGKIIAWTWPISIPLEFLLQIFYTLDLEKLKQDLKDDDEN